MFGKVAIRAGSVLAALALLAAVFLVRFDIPRDEAVKRYANASSRFLPLPSGAVAHVRDQGNKTGPAVVLIHGMNASLHLWEPWVQRLGGEFRIVTLDLPGHGLTTAAKAEKFSVQSLAAFVDEVVTALDLRGIVVGGNSLGGEVAWTYALQHPGKIRGLALLDSAGMPIGKDMELPFAFRLARTPVANNLMLYITPRSMVEEVIKDAFWDDQLITPELIDQVHELMLVEGNRAATIEIFAALQPDDASIARLAEIKSPALILWGDRDKLIPVRYAARFHDLLPNSRVITFPEAGHLPMVEAPDASATIMAEFLRGLARSSEALRGPGPVK